MALPTEKALSAKDLQEELLRRKNTPRLFFGAQSELRAAFERVFREAPNFRNSEQLRTEIEKLAVLQQERRQSHGRRHLAPFDPSKSLELRVFLEFLKRGQNGIEGVPEFRDMSEGTQSFLSWTAGPGGGYLVPQEMWPVIAESMAETDPLLDEDVVTVIPADPADGLTTRPIRIGGWDLTQAEGAQVGEGSQTTLVAQPLISAGTLNGWMFRGSQLITLQFEEDVPNALDALARMLGVALARGVGAALVNGSGDSAPEGLLTGAEDSNVTTAAAGALSLDDFESIYFSVNKWYRRSPKCAWVMADETYQLARKAVDSNNRPLLNIERDEEVIMGKRVLVSPSMPYIAGSQGIVFGDLSHFFCRLSGVFLNRSTEVMPGIEYGRVLIDGRMRADSMVFDPSSNTESPTPPIVYATLHS